MQDFFSINVYNISHNYLANVINKCNLFDHCPMAFLKVDNIILNTNYIASIKLESQTFTGERSLSVLMATPRFPLLAGADNTSPELYHYEWLHFTGRQAQGLRDYFSSYNNVIDLLPQERQEECERVS